ncbi:MAG: DUF502 domain-containing protein [Planctomycetota bacterium]|nr:DUF502 domain-containing protein [Planctomycetota bacterium]
MAKSFMSDFRQFFLRGLAAVLPTLITVMILIYVFKFVDSYLGKYMNVGVQWLVVQAGAARTTPFSWRGPDKAWDVVKAAWQDYHLGWIGFTLAIAGIYIVGRFVASFVGRGLWKLVDQTLYRTPVIRQVYPHVKQVTDFLLSEKKLEFSRVVAVEYPRKGIWSVGLVTGPGMRKLCTQISKDLLTIFIPSSPTPVTGYTITVRRDDVIDLPISIDDALRFTVSGGVIMPVSQQLGKAETDQARQGMLPASQDKESPA